MSHHAMQNLASFSYPNGKKRRPLRIATPMFYIYSILYNIIIFERPEAIIKIFVKQKE
jgi:hypothetical protein